MISNMVRTENKIGGYRFECQDSSAHTNIEIKIWVPF